MPPSRPPVSVKMTFWIGSSSDDDEEPRQQKTFSQDQGTQPARLGLPPGVEPTKPSAGSYDYSGMHDHGPLVPPREGGEMAQLIGCVQAAKQYSIGNMTDKTVSRKFYEGTGRLIAMDR
ncbi:expressed unknown protein [Seminavis robusta]|uniref:Uncharacterized protein n=1 Tax=Seminavis robusta TaxID=568900 RepID=A0A9N8HAC9_9STRA|nr:expressed unknown protein [Seminavis robusta]|eukprot:Sro219_g090460.1 n/a (119) ;mRNA; f:46176-46826